MKRTGQGPGDKRMVMADDAWVFMEYSGPAADRQGVLNAAA
ncbi:MULTISPECIES: hypothetical protein [unclassified Paenibacillus]|nr:hypothetical protein [Paenibacillus sp. FSL H8-0259]